MSYDYTMIFFLLFLSHNLSRVAKKKKKKIVLNSNMYCPSQISLNTPQVNSIQLQIPLNSLSVLFNIIKPGGF